MDLLLGKTRRRQKKTKEWSNFFKTAFFGHILKKSAHSLFGAWFFLLVHIWFTPSEGPKGFVNCFFQKSYNGSWTMEKCCLPWSDFMVHGVNQPLRTHTTI